MSFPFAQPFAVSACICYATSSRKLNTILIRNVLGRNTSAGVVNSIYSVSLSSWLAHSFMPIADALSVAYQRYINSITAAPIIAKIAWWMRSSDLYILINGNGFVYQIFRHKIDLNRFASTVRWWPIFLGRRERSLGAPLRHWRTLNFGNNTTHTPITICIMKIIHSNLIRATNGSD